MPEEQVPPPPSDSSSIQEQVEEKKTSRRKTYGTFGGVFVPTLLTILGVIMYLREGWVVGNAGLLGAWGVILLAFGITGFTGLSLSSITTNIRIGSGGAFNVISQSLGLEVGGSVGVPLYLSQALAVSMYIFGFREGWLWIFPEHPALLVDLGLFAVIFVIAFISAGLAFRIQYVILAIIVGSLISIGATVFQGALEYDPTWIGSFRGSAEGGFEGIGFWAVFAVFFPASTGIMAGANMSGELENPKRAIPVGTLSAIGVSVVVYMVLAYWLATVAPPDALVENYTVMVDRAAWGPIVLAGLLGATFSSALSSLVGAPRILQALGEHSVLPGSGWLSVRTRTGEPRNALYLTGAIVLAALMLRSLNAVAPMITMFFLITYAMINVVVFLEQSMGLVSFRPLFRIPRLVSGIGALGCIFAMFVVNPAFSLVAVAVVLGIHAILIRRKLEAPFGDVRSGLFVALAEWAAQKVGSLTAGRERIWRANLLVPVQDPSEVWHRLGLYRDLARPNGFIKLVGLTDELSEDRLEEDLDDLCGSLQSDGVFSSCTVISSASFSENLGAGVEAFGGTFFRPNVLTLTLPDDQERRAGVQHLLDMARKEQMGTALLVEASRGSPYQRESVNVWFEDQGEGWELSMEMRNQDLAVLLGYKLMKNWDARLRLVARVDDADEASAARNYLADLKELARLPDAEIVVAEEVGRQAGGAPRADINLLPLPAHPELGRLVSTAEALGGPCLFTRDSGKESALA
ncbi:MAG: amino acid permease [Candidatus Longimicrobiales bacterium M2_2A_002]